MRLPREIVDLPESATLRRNGLDVVAARRELARAECPDGRVTIGDAEGIDLFRPIRVRPGAYRVVVYEWQHPRRGSVNLALLVASCDKPSGILRPIAVEQVFAPHVEGLPVDCAALWVRVGVATLRVNSGLGDGVYPVYARKSLASPPDLILVDFKVWELRNYIERPGWTVDEYGLPFETRA